MDQDDELLQRITLNPRVLLGKPTIRGLRISVEQILEALGHGVSEESLLADYPDLEALDLQAAMLYAAKTLAHEEVFAVAEA